MNLKQLERARVYAEALVNLAQYDVRGSVTDAKLLLAAVIELAALKHIPQAIPDVQRASAASSAPIQDQRAA